MDTSSFSSPNGMVPPEQRQATLSQADQEAVARGGRIQYADQFSAVIVYGKPVNHVLHLLITILLFGIWLIVWILIAITGGERREVIAVDDFGRINRRRA